jgi:hypothetical protein
VLAAFYEALRLFRTYNLTLVNVLSISADADSASGYIMIREAFEDTVLEIPNPHGEEGSKIVPVPKGTQVLVDMIGVRECISPLDTFTMSTLTGDH